MYKYYNIIKNFCFVTIPSFVIFILFCEFVVFRFILPASDFPVCHMLISPEDICRYDGTDSNREGIYREGFPAEIIAHYKINTEGWNSNREFSETKNNKKRIAIIGDSFVEALQVDVGKSLAENIEYELRKYGKDVEVYRFGISGIPLSQYLYTMRYVKKKYAPDIYIINIVSNDLLDSIYGYDNSNRTFMQFTLKDLHWIEVKPDPNIQLRASNAVRRFFRRSAIARYFCYNLKLYSRLNILYDKIRGIDLNKAYKMNIEMNSAIGKRDTIQDLCNHIFLQCKSLLSSNNKLLFVFPPNTRAIYQGKDPKAEEIYELFKIPKEAAEKLSLPFLDLNEAFILDFKNNRQPFEFKNNYHWNERGHLIAGKTIAAFILVNKWTKEEN